MAERAQQRFRLLVEAGDLLASSLSPETTLRQLADFVVARMADYCVTYGFDGKQIRRLGLAHRIPDKVRLVESLASSVQPSLDDPVSVGPVIRTGQESLVSEVVDAHLDALPWDPSYIAKIRELAPRSSMIVPLVARGRTLGAITFATTADSERRYDQEDLEVAKELGARAAMFQRLYQLVDKLC